MYNFTFLDMNCKLFLQIFYNQTMYFQTQLQEPFCSLHIMKEFFNPHYQSQQVQSQLHSRLLQSFHIKRLEKLDLSHSNRGEFLNTMIQESPCCPLKSLWKNLNLLLNNLIHRMSCKCTFKFLPVLKAPKTDGLSSLEVKGSSRFPLLK